MSDPDTTGQLDAVQRRVAFTDEGGPTVAAVNTISQEYATPAADLWEAVTSADRIARWFAKVDGDLRLGGRYQVQNNANGTVQSCDAPNAYTVTWEFGGAVTLLTVRVADLGGDRSRLTLEHSGDTPREFWDQFGPGATGVGWDLGMLGLALHLATGADAPAETTEWGMSDDARAFMTDSAHRWADAAIAAGADPTAAREASERTVGFYTGMAG